MKNSLFVICILLLLVSASFAVNPTNASLKGNYSFQLASAHMNGWSASITCYSQGSSYTVTAGGTDVSNQSVLGVVTFDGKGNATGTFSQYGTFDQAESNATVVPSCTPGDSNNGYAVFDPATSGTFTGTYSIQPTGFGSLDLTIAGGDTADFVLELGGTAAVRTSVFMTQYDPTTYKMEVSGSAVLQ